jgi:hypothetical protein
VAPDDRVIESHAHSMTLTRAIRGCERFRTPATRPLLRSFHS